MPFEKAAPLAFTSFQHPSLKVQINIMLVKVTIHIHCAKRGQIQPASRSFKKRSSHIRAAASQNFRVKKKKKGGTSKLLSDMMIHLYAQSMIGHAFTVQNGEKKDIRTFFNILRGQLIIFY